jgi:nucleoside-diphosphate-sugar epimerase
MRALVTGGTGRIGSAVAVRLRAEGWSVVAAGQADGNLAEVDATQALVTRVVAELGGLDPVSYKQLTLPTILRV